MSRWRLIRQELLRIRRIERTVTAAPMTLSPKTIPPSSSHRLSGAFFFGAASTVGAVLDRIADQRRNLVLDFSAVPFLDSTAANIIEGVARKAERDGIRFIITGASPTVRRMLLAHQICPPRVEYAGSIDKALSRIDRANQSNSS